MIGLLQIRAVARPLFWAAGLFAFVMAVLPDPPPIPGDPPDKLQHGAAFLVLAVLGIAAYPALRKRYLLLGLAAFGALIEVVQGLPFVGRDRDPVDWLVDVGAALIVLAAVAVWSLWKARPWSS